MNTLCENTIETILKNFQIYIVKFKGLLCKIEGDFCSCNSVIRQVMVNNPKQAKRCKEYNFNNKITIF